MAQPRHLYQLGLKGRSLRSRAGVGGSRTVAYMECSQCAKSGMVNMSKCLPPEVIDKKFIGLCWALDPNICGDCNAKLKSDRTNRRTEMASIPTGGAIKATVLMLQMLNDNFDAAHGKYADGWNDARISKETKLSIETVTSYRREGFGDIKEPDELQKIREDINTVDTLSKEKHGELMQAIAELRTQLAAATKRYSA